MTRNPDWRTALTQYVIETAGDAFRPGTTDCALWAAGAVKAMTGKDLAHGFRSYKTLEEGEAKLREAGYDDHVALVAAKLEEIPPSMAQVGDVVVVDDDALGIVQGEMIYVAAPGGRALVPLTRARRAFRV